MVASRQRQQAAQRPIYSNLSYSRVILAQPGDAMTAPRRRNGAPVAFIERSCEGKRRFPDELTARAVGMSDAELSGDKLYVYRCRSEERRVGKEWVSTCRYGWCADHK